MKIWDIAAEVERALSTTKRRAERIAGPEVDLIRKGLEKSFAGGPNFWPLWEVLDDSVGLQDEHSWMMIASFNSGQPIHMLFNPEDEPAMFVFNSESDVVAVLAECFGFELYLTDPACSYLLCVNHHDFLIADGRAKVWLEGMKVSGGHEHLPLASGATAMKFPQYSRVCLATDKYRYHGVPAGTVGTILEIWNGGEAYEVDFSDAEGITIAQLALPGNELIPLAASEAPRAR